MTDDSQQRTAGVHYASIPGDLRRYVRSQLTRIRSGHDIEADDIVQEAMLRVWCTGERGGIRNGNGYLFRTARNLIIDIGRRRVAQPVDCDSSRLEEPAVRAASSTALSPERHAIAEQDLDIVLDAIGRLPERCRAAFFLQRSTGYSYSQVASMLNMSESMVQKHMARALLALHKALPC